MLGSGFFDTVRLVLYIKFFLFILGNLNNKILSYVKYEPLAEGLGIFGALVICFASLEVIQLLASPLVRLIAPNPHVPQYVIEYQVDSGVSDCSDLDSLAPDSSEEDSM